VALRSETGFQVVMMDIDYFKKYNDTYGHLKGDELLKDLAGLLSRHIRSSGMAEQFDRLLDMADQALYQSKQDGRDRVTLARPDASAGQSDLI